MHPFCVVGCVFSSSISDLLKMNLEAHSRTLPLPPVEALSVDFGDERSYRATRGTRGPVLACCCNFRQEGRLCFLNNAKQSNLKWLKFKETKDLLIDLSFSTGGNVCLTIPLQVKYVPTI